MKADARTVAVGRASSNPRATREREVGPLNNSNPNSTVKVSRHLWEYDHPFYCAEGNYYTSGDQWDEVYTSYDSWADFIAEWGDTDPDLNLVFRWDWIKSNPDDYEPDDGAIRVPEDKLLVFWVLQRKALLRTTVCAVTAADEPAVRAWLADRAKAIAAIWEPISLTHSGERR